MSIKKDVKVYDAPLRALHWLFAISFLFAFGLAKTFEHTAQFPFHMLWGMVLVFTTVIRIIWGVVGTKHGKFNSFTFAPSHLVEYMKNVFPLSNTDTKEYEGHNPASSYAAIAMFVLALTLGATGSGMILGFGGEVFEEIHEVAVNLFVITAIAHILGVIIHQVKYKDKIYLTMINGVKKLAKKNVAPSASGTSIALVIVLMVASFAGYVFTSYDPASGNLTAFGQNLQLMEDEDEDHEQDGDENHEQGVEHHDENGEDD